MTFSKFFTFLILFSLFSSPSFSKAANVDLVNKSIENLATLSEKAFSENPTDIGKINLALYYLKNLQDAHREGMDYFEFQLKANDCETAKRFLTQLAKAFHSPTQEVKCTDKNLLVGFFGLAKDMDPDNFDFPRSMPIWCNTVGRHGLISNAAEANELQDLGLKFGELVTKQSGNYEVTIDTCDFKPRNISYEPSSINYIVKVY